MSRVRLGLVLSAIAVSCAQPRAGLRPDTIAARQARSMAVSVFVEEETFVVPPPPTISYPIGGLGAAAAAAWAPIMAGKRFLKDHQMENPGPRLGAQLSDALSRRYSLASKVIVHTGPRQTVDGVPAEDWPPVIEGVDLVLSIHTRRWGFDVTRTEGLEGVRHAAIFDFQVTLTDNRDKSVLARGDCSGEVRPAQGAPPTEEQIVANDAAMLRTLLVEAIDICRDECESQLFFTSAARRPPRPKPPPRPVYPTVSPPPA